MKASRAVFLLNEEMTEVTSPDGVTFPVLHAQASSPMKLWTPLHVWFKDDSGQLWYSISDLFGSKQLNCRKVDNDRSRAMKTCAILDYRLQKQDKPEGCVELPEELFRLWKEVPTELWNVWDYLHPIKEWLVKQQPKAVICRGELSAVFWVHDWCVLLDAALYVPVFKMTAVDTPVGGDTVKTQIRKFCKYRQVLGQPLVDNPTFEINENWSKEK